MSTFRISRKPIRLALSLIVLVSSFALTAGGISYLETHSSLNPITYESDLELIMRLLSISTLFAATFFYLTGCATTTGTVIAPVIEAGPVAAEPLQAQVVGLLWFNPLVRRDYPTEWQLLWTLGLSKPNVRDFQVRDKPHKFTTVQPIAPPVSNQFNDTFTGYFLRYMERAFRPIGSRYVGNSNYFYTVQPKSPKHWRELAGIHVEFAIPDRPELNPDEAAEIVRERIRKQFAIGRSPTLSSRNTPPDVRITAGGANAGFGSLAAALDYLETHPDETVWAMTWDAPEHPLDERMTENCVLLVLAGPTYDTAREPLAWIARPAVSRLDDFEVKPGEPRLVQAWRAAMDAAAANANRPLADLGYLIHDAGRASDAAGKRLATLGQALGEPLPEFDILKQGFNTTALLGDTGAGTALTNVALAIAYAHHKGTPVLVAGTTEADAAAAVVVTPPTRARVFDPDKDWFRARGERNAYLPWWGLRKDVDWSTYMQGYSE